MAYDSQQANLDAVSDLTTLVHEIYTQDVLPNVAWDSVSAQMFKKAGKDEGFEYTGEKLVGAVDLLRPHGALGTQGQLPDSATTNPANWETTPARRYVRRAIDNFVEKRASKGRGSFGDLGERLLNQMWDAMSLMEIRHAVGSSDGVLCHAAVRTSSTVFTVDNGFGHTGMDPLVLLDEGMVIAWLDTSAANAVGGAARISSINYSTGQITVDSGATWEPSATLADGDLIVAATTTSISADYFATEYQNAKNGFLDIIDPDGASTTVFNIAQGTYPRWKPYRQASSTFDHIEVTEFLRKLKAKSTAPVGPDSHTLLTNGAVVAELARTLVGFQQQQQLGKTLEGGYQTVRVAGMDIAEDDFQLHDVLYAVCMEDIHTVSLVEAGYFDEDGSMYSRLADFDGKEWFVRDYCNSFATRRNRLGALTGITLANVSGDDFTPTPNY